MSLQNPKIDIKKIEEAANAAAEKAYLKEIEDYYTGYGSPYREMIQEGLKTQKFKYPLELPNILEKINSSLSAEVDKIANTAIANSYIPMVSDALVGMKKNLKLSELLKKVIEEIEPDEEETDDFSFSYTKDKNHGWLNCSLVVPNNFYEFTLHTVYEKGNEHKYQALGFPHNKSKSGYGNNTMKVYKDDIKIEMPFTPNILEDKVLRIFFKMMITNTFIELDVDDFQEDMFPERECFC